MSKKAIQYIKKNVFFILFAFFCSISVISQSEFINSFHIISRILPKTIIAIHYALVILICLFIVLKEIKFSYFSLIMAIIGLVIYNFSSHFSVLTVSLFLIAFSNKDFVSVAKVAFFSIGITFAIVVLSSLINLIPNTPYTRGEKLRYALGFTYATLPQSLCFFLITCRAYVKKHKMHYLELLGFVLLDTALYILTDTRSGFMLCLLCCLVIFISKLIKDREKITNILNVKWIRYLIVLLPLLSFLCFTLLFTFYNENSPIFVKLDNVFSFRLSLTKQAFLNQKITLFGIDINWNAGGEYIGVDNAFYRMFFDTGIFGALFTLVLCTLTMYTAVKNRDFCFILIFIAVLLDSFVEPYIIDIRYNCCILYLIELSISKKQTDTQSLNLNHNSASN